jgi:hypothetical protein
VNRNIADFINAEHIAVVGVSSRKNKFGNAVYKSLKARGYHVYPVHPRLSEFEGGECFNDLKELPSEVEAAVICTKPENAIAALQQAGGSNIKRIWFQQGADFSEAAAMAKSAGMDITIGKCILMYAPPVTGIHAFHRFLARLFGKL